MSRIRHLALEDIPQVVALYQNRFSSTGRDSAVQVPDPAQTTSLIKSFEEIFFRNPWYEERISSLVCEMGDGSILGFLGVTPRKMIINKRSITVAISVHHMTDPTRQTGLTGIQLLKTFFSGSQDLSLTDGANRTGRKVWMGLGGQAAHIYSFNWVKILRPSDYALSRAVIKLPLLSALSPVTQPLCTVSDGGLIQMMPHRFRFDQPDLVTSNLDDESLLACITKLSASYSLRPKYDDLSLPWIMRRIEKYKLIGSLQKVALCDHEGEMIGWYLYLLRPGGESEVVQMGALGNKQEVVFDHLLHHAWKNGSVLITGRVDPNWMQTISNRECSFNCEPHWVLFQTRDNEISQAIGQGSAFLSLLEGELATSYQL